VYQYEDLRGGISAFHFEGEGLYAMMTYRLSALKCGH